MTLLGRRAEREVLDQLLNDMLAARSRVLVLRGEAGVGKSALLRYLADRASGAHVARAAGIESEMELAYSGLHQLCAPMLGALERLPSPQRDALGTVFGLADGTPPDRFLVGLATLSLLAEVAEQEPLVCILDDAQWFDQASAQIFGFVGRRLLAERVAIVCAARTGTGNDVLDEFPALAIHGLADDAARALVLDNLRGPLDAAICDQIVTESQGNPLALLEFPRAWSVGELAGGFGFPSSQPVATKIERSYAQRLQTLPADTQLAVLTAAAEPLGDPALFHGAATSLGIDATALDAAVDAGLVTVGRRVEFTHPLVRSSAYRSAAAQDRHRVHRALAEVTDPELDPDRRAWHRARATSGPDAEIADELERSAGRAEARGGAAAAAAFLDRSVDLTADATRRTQRALTAAEAKHRAGAPDAALRLLAIAQAGRLDDLERARAQLLRAQIAFAVNRGSDAPPLFLEAAKHLEPLDASLARETYLEAFSAALFADRLARHGGVREVAEAVLEADWGPTSTGSPRAFDLLLDGVAVLTTRGYAAGAPMLKRALLAFRDEPMSDEEALRWLWLASRVARAMGDDASWDELTDRHVRLARRAGVLSLLPIALIERFSVQLFLGDLASAASLIVEAEAVVEAAGSHLAPLGAISLACWRGREAEASALIDASRNEVVSRGEGLWLVATEWASAVLFNGLGRYEDALAAAQQAAEHPHELGVSTWVPTELVEAAVRSGHPELAASALERLKEISRASGTEWALGVEARSRALVSESDAAERLYREAIERLGRTRVRVALARAHLLYGEWLRREGRRVDAREHLREAYALYTDMEMEGFAERARRELLATGERVRKRNPETGSHLTAQEAQIVKLVGEGRTNPEIGAQLYISPRTVEWHLRKVFTKLGISSRKELRGVAPKDERPSIPV